MTIDPSAQAIAAYASQAEVLRSRYDAVSSDDVLSAVRDLVPQEPMRVLDIGAGSGRDAVWFAARGHKVTAAEPVAEFRAVIARRLPNAAIVDARLPDLDNITGPFDLILANAVWQHLTAGERVAAFARMSGLLGTAGRLILSLRHGSVCLGSRFSLSIRKKKLRVRSRPGWHFAVAFLHPRTSRKMPLLTLPGLGLSSRRKQ